MATLKEKDLAFWLQNKLLSDWGSDQLALFLTVDVLQQIKLKYPSLEPAIKLRFLFSLLGVKKKQMTAELVQEISEILQMALKDEDEWVKITAEMFFPITSKKPHMELDVKYPAFQQFQDHLEPKIGNTKFHFNNF